MSGAGLPPRAALVASATAVALSRGGFVDADPLIVALSEAQRALSGLRAGDRLHGLQAPVRAILTARLRGDEYGFSLGRHQLVSALQGYWGAMALGGEV